MSEFYYSCLVHYILLICIRIGFFFKKQFTDLDESNSQVTERSLILENAILTYCLMVSFSVNRVRLRWYLKPPTKNHRCCLPKFRHKLHDIRTCSRRRRICRWIESQRDFCEECQRSKYCLPLQIYPACSPNFTQISKRGI